MITEKIEIFLEVADHLCFSTVAKKHYTTQPTISRQIATLESEWNVRLFERTNKGLHLTPEGAVMLDCCKRMKKMCEAALSRAHNLEISSRNRIHLGFLEILDTDRIFLPLLQEFADDYPNLDITVSYHSFEKLRKGLEKNEFDIIYTYDFDVKNIAGNTAFDMLFSVKPLFILGKKHPLYEKEELHIADLADEIFFLPEEKDAPGREEDLRIILNAHGIRGCKIRFMPNLESALFQVYAGRGVTMSDNVAKASTKGEIRCIELERYQGNLNLVAVWNKDNLNPVLPLLLNRLQ